LISAAELERWAAEAAAALLRCDSLGEAVECHSDVPLAWLGPGYVDCMVLVVDHPGVMFPAETGQRESFGVAQARSCAGYVKRVPEACFVAHLPEPFRPPDRGVLLTVFGKRDDERFGQDVLRRRCPGLCALFGRC
jgi:hypothetical protein